MIELSGTHGWLLTHKAFVSIACLSGAACLLQSTLVKTQAIIILLHALLFKHWCLQSQQTGCPPPREQLPTAYAAANSPLRSIGHNA